MGIETAEASSVQWQNRARESERGEQFRGGVWLMPRVMDRRGTGWAALHGGPVEALGVICHNERCGRPFPAPSAPLCSKGATSKIWLLIVSAGITTAFFSIRKPEPKGSMFFEGFPSDNCRRNGSSCKFGRDRWFVVTPPCRPERRTPWQGAILEAVSSYAARGADRRFRK